MSYCIHIVTVDDTPSFKYNADVHPAIGDYVFYRADRFKVTAVCHIIGSAYHIAGETNKLDFVELTVIPY